MQLHDQQWSNTVLSERPSVFNEALQLVIDADGSVFEAEKIESATYSGSKENTDIRDLAAKRYKELTGLKANSRRLYDLAIGLYLKKFDKK